MKTSNATEAKTLKQLIDGYAKIRVELRKTIVGQNEVIEQLMISLFAGGHCLITGAPGLAKTLLVKTISHILSLQFSRIQFTPDLMPADITGSEMLTETGRSRKLTFMPGPVFANMVLADEINRTPPKTQAALLEAMQEHQVTAAGQRHPLPEPFFVLATQNPIEMEGTYPLPEAQLDRFMFNIVIDYLPEDEELEVVQLTTAEPAKPGKPIFTAKAMQRFIALVRKVPVAEDVSRYAVRLAAASRPLQDGSLEYVDKWVNWGAGLRAAQFLILGAKARTLIQGNTHVTVEDVQALARPVLRHRILVNYRAEAEGITTEKVIEHLLETVSTEIK